VNEPSFILNGTQIFDGPTREGLLVLKTISEVGAE
jgi:hypothetical protein